MIKLPSAPYEYFIKKKAKVQSNCCISYGKNYYSVPYRFIGETVTLRAYQNRIEICRFRSNGPLNSVAAD